MRTHEHGARRRQRRCARPSLAVWGLSLLASLLPRTAVSVSAAASVRAAAPQQAASLAIWSLSLSASLLSQTAVSVAASKQAASLAKESRSGVEEAEKVAAAAAAEQAEQPEQTASATAAAEQTEQTAPPTAPTTAPPTSAWPSNLEFLATSSDTEFFNFVLPLANMTKFSYASTWGSYYNPKEANATPPGWIKLDYEANPEGGGMRALSFIQPSSGRGVVAYRGTDLGSAPSAKVDLCANMFMAELPLPAYCGPYSNHTLDYLSRALEYAQHAWELYPELEWVYTGHSLGAELAELVAAVRRSKAVVFSTPGLYKVMKARTHVSPGDVGSWQVLALYKEWDPLHFTVPGQLPGASCYWPEAPEPGCQECKQVGFNITRPSCRLCFSKTHTYNLYMDELEAYRRPQHCGSPPISTPEVVMDI